MDLSNHSDKFNMDCLNLNLVKKENYVFGRNGTGKSTIAKEIEEQYSSTYDVRIFKDFEGVLERDRLGSVALGNIK